MPIITATGVGSGLDLNGLIDKLVAAERNPKVFRLDIKEAGFQAKISAFGTLKSALSSFQSSLISLTTLATFQTRTATLSDLSLFSVSATSIASAGTYSIEVTQLAQSHTVTSKAFTNVTDTVGTGTLTFQFGTYAASTFTPNPDKVSKTVTIGSADSSLQGIRDAVNNADIGVTATIVDDGSGNRLQFTGDDSGAKNSLKITVSDTSDASDLDDAGLSQLAYDPEGSAGSGKNLTESLVAQDASLKINGLVITRSTNTVTGAIQGVTLNLLKASVGSPVTLTVAIDQSGMTAKINSFISAYNDLIVTNNALSSYDPETKIAGTLQADATLRGITSQIRQIAGGDVTGLAGSYVFLLDIGITTEKGGTLVLDDSKLQAALTADADAVGKLFAAVGTPSDSLTNYTSATSKTQAGTYAVDVTQLATQGLYTGTATVLTVDSTNKTFVLSVDGIQSGTITLTEGTYTGAALAAEIQVQINNDTSLSDAGVSVTVAYDTDHFVITSSRYGSASKVQITSINSDLGLSSGTQSDGLDVAGSIGGLLAAGSGRFLTGVGAADGLKIEITGGSTGLRGSVVFSRGVADQLDELMTRFLDSDGALEVKVDGARDRIEDITGQREVLDKRLVRLEKRLRAQFVALDVLLAQLQATGNYLAQQLANLPKVQVFRAR